MAALLDIGQPINCAVCQLDLVATVPRSTVLARHRIMKTNGVLPSCTVAQTAFLLVILLTPLRIVAVV